MVAFSRSPAVAGGPAAGVAMPPEWSGDSQNIGSLRHRFGKNGAREFLALIQERDPELFWAGFLTFGSRLEAQGRLEAASEVFAWVAATPAGKFSAQAASRLEALRGGGNFGLRVERIVDRFVGQATDFRIILPMLLAGPAFQITKNLTWARLLNSPAAHIVSRGRGAEALASLAAFGTEVTVFTGAHRLLGTEIPGIASPTFSQDWVSAALALGVLKGSFWVGNKSLGKGFPSLSRQGLGSGVLSQSTLFLGLLATHRLEQHFGWRPQNDAGGVADVLGSMFALQAGAHLGRRVLGARWSGFENELRLKGQELRELQTHWAQIPDLAPAPMGPPIFLSVKTPLERIFGWMGGRAIAKPSSEPSALDQLRPIFNKFPKLKKALGKTGFSYPQMLNLLNMVAGHAEGEIEEVLHYLPSALGAMHKANWQYERVYAFLEMLALKGDYFRYRVRHLPSALTAVRQYSEGTDEKYRFLYEIGDLSGSFADRVFANLPTAAAGAKGQGWPLALSKDLFSEIIRQGGFQAGVALGHLEPALRSLLEEFWSLEMKIKMIGLLARPAPDDMTMAWRFSEGFPQAMGQMHHLWGPTDDNFRLLAKVLGPDSKGMDEALTFFPGSIQALKKMGWDRGRIFEYAYEAAHRAGSARGRVFHWTPYLVQGLQTKQLEEAEVEDLMLDVAEQAPRLPDFAFIGFIQSLLQQNVALKRWEN